MSYTGMCTLQLGSSGRGAGLGWGRALGARAEGRLSKAVVQKRAGRKKRDAKMVILPFISGWGNRKTVAAPICVSAHLVMPNDVLSLFSLALLTFSATQKKHKRALGLSWCVFIKQTCFIPHSNPLQMDHPQCFSHDLLCFEIKCNCALCLL